jgi:hypothetical protein
MERNVPNSESCNDEPYAEYSQNGENEPIIRNERTEYRNPLRFSVIPMNQIKYKIL